MATNDPPRQLSLVRYASDSREVVLRHGSSVVVYDPNLKELSLRKSSQGSVGLTDCPFCHRPLNENASPYEHKDDEPEEDHGFVNPDYFRMLAHSIPASPNPSRPTSPFKQLPAFQTEGSRTGYDRTPPDDAEFVGSVPAPQSSDQEIRGSSFVPNYFKSFFVEKRELGRGGRGVVLLVEHVLDSVSLGEFACKRIPVGNDHGWLEKVLVEVQLLQRLNHQNLVSYQHVWLEDAQISNFGPSVPCIFILQQYCNAGDLQNYILGSSKPHNNPEELKARMRRRSKGQLGMAERPEPPRRMHFDEIFNFFRDITSGLHHLHANGYIHRDLKPSNCLLNATEQKLTVHVSDFGEVQAASAKRSSTGATGTISYCAPEVLRREGHGGQFGNFSTKSDIFSLGMIVYFMCFGHLPYSNADAMNDENEDIDQLRAEVSMWSGFDESVRTRTDLPPRLYSFLKRLLSPNPADRPSTEHILQAIKAGGDIDSLPNPMLDFGESGPRITSAESPARPAPTRARSRKHSSGLARPGLSTRGRHQSTGEVMQSPSPRRRDAVSDSPLRSESGVILSTRKIGTPSHSPPQTEANTPPASEQTIPKARLIMPPPPTLSDRLVGALYHENAVLVFKGMLFCFKLITLSWPCTPYAAKPVVFYALMCLSILDFLLDRGLVGSLSLLGIHLIVCSIAGRWGYFCSQGLLMWDTNA